jgi:glycosyltransferase involved in cell wall biosynthesis
MNIRCESMLGTSHSWAVTMRNLLLQFDDMNHNIFINSTNGQDLIPEALKRNIGRANNTDADIDISYTLPRNFKHRFSSSSKLKLAIYNYETSIMPKDWKDDIRHIDYALPSSNFSKEVFVRSGWPEERCIVIPHGINSDDFLDKRKLKLGNSRGFRFLNVSIPHYRKNIDILLDAYYSSFTDDDDVCLVLKTKLQKPNNYFEVDVRKQIIHAQKKHFKGKKLPQIEVIQRRLDSMVPLYNSCDSLVSSSSSEGFGLPLLEGLAANMLVIAPECSGQLDFLSKRNSILVDTQVVKAGRRYQYWKPSPGATTYMPRVDSLSESMRFAFDNRVNIRDEFSEESRSTVSKFSWKSAANKILEIR